MSELDDAVANVVYDLSQLDQKWWFFVVRRLMIESQEVGRREARAELAALRDSERYWQEQAETQRAEAAAQREIVAKLVSARIYLVESYVNAPAVAEPLPLVERIAELEQAVNEARELLTSLEWNDWDKRIDVWLDTHPAPAAQQTPEERD